MEAVTQFWNEVWSEGRVELLPELFAEGAVENGEVLDLEGFKMGVLRWREIFPDFRVHIDESLIVGEDRVVTRVTYTGTQVLPWAGLPATGKSTRVIGIDIFRLANGKITELWHSADHLELAIQLGGKIVEKEI
ncbi:MAG: ester cyclase [Fimbriimonadales bacterium]